MTRNSHQTAPTAQMAAVPRTPAQIRKPVRPRNPPKPRSPLRPRSSPKPRNPPRLKNPPRPRSLPRPRNPPKPKRPLRPQNPPRLKSQLRQQRLPLPPTRSHHRPPRHHRLRRPPRRHRHRRLPRRHSLRRLPRHLRPRRLITVREITSPSYPWADTYLSYLYNINCKIRPWLPPQNHGLIFTQYSISYFIQILSLSSRIHNVVNDIHIFRTVFFVHRGRGFPEPFFFPGIQLRHHTACSPDPVF